MKNMKKTLLIVAALAVLLAVAVGFTVAFLVDTDGPVVNTFVPSQVPSEVVENFEGKVKSNVKIKNNGNIDAYIRAAVVFTWQNADGDVYPVTPSVGTDYQINWKKTNWFEKGGYYYYKKKVAPGATTEELFTDCKPLKAAPADGYTLHVEILGSAIQAEPDYVVERVWGVQVTTATDGTKTISPN